MLDQDGSEIVKSYMTKGLLTIDKNKTILDAAEVMAKLEVGSLLVTENEDPIGILTERDVVSKVVAKKLSSDSIKVSDAMSFPIISIDSMQSISDALILMGKKETNHLVVTDKDEAVGMFSLVNIINLESYRLDV